jgi:hypothetical protein
MAVAGSIVVTTADRGDNVTEYSIAWTSDAAGAVTENPVAVKSGKIIGVKFIPSAVTAPSAAYDVTVIDGESVDMVTGLGANLSATASTRSVPLVNSTEKLFFEGGNLTPTVANAGNAKLGTIILWVQGAY